jgi:MoaA/NifB/PqqE/SkfB family radical SAM enzyme
MHRIRSLRLQLTTACNLRCSYCYQRRGRERRVAWSTLRRALDWALCARSPDPQIVFSGGEPLIEAQLIRRAVEYLESRESGARLTLDTNGLLLDDATAAYLVEHDFDLDVSFDGVEPAQERRAPGTFTRLDRLLDHLRREYPAYYRRHSRVSMTVLPETLPHLADSLAYFVAKRVPEIAFAPVFVPGRPFTPAQIATLEAQFDRVLRLSLDHYRETGEIPLAALRPAAAVRSAAALPPAAVVRSAAALPPAAVVRSAAALPPAAVRHAASSRSAYRCGAVRGDAPTVAVNGDIYGCALLVDRTHARAPRSLREELRDLRIGNLRDDDLGDRLAGFRRRARTSPLFRPPQPASAGKGACADCPARENCSVCPVAMRLAGAQGEPDADQQPCADANWPCAFTRVASRVQAEFTRAAGGRRVAAQPRPPAGHAVLERFLGRPLPPAMRRPPTRA